jgi:4-cresol dehydrogenase (hydroxylating)
MAGREQLDAALVEWRTLLGEDGVAPDEEALNRYARTTQPAGTRPCCVLYPDSTEAVQETVRIAAAHGAGLYPISRGRNWGYGDACAPEDGSAIVDLSRMDRILEIDAELGYAVVEPGVTQQQLYEELQRRAPGFWMDCTGAGRGASVVGNALDRGFGHTPYGDHMRTSCGLEVVLADGRVLHTGFGHYAGAKAARVFPYGVGPWLDGLFTQSNLGIVTKLGLWLYPEPEAFRFFYIKVVVISLLCECVA